MSSYKTRRKWLDIAMADDGKVETSKNQAPWIKKFWPATTYPKGYDNREPYCAAALAYTLREWLKLPEARKLFGFTPEQAEAWRCKSARVFDWVEWAKSNNLTILPKHCILHSADIAVYTYSHIELVEDDDGTTKGPFVAMGFNTNAAGSRDGEGAFLKPRSRSSIKCFIRLIP